MAVFPENMNRLDANDTGKSFSILENYIRYMGERMEFAMGNMTRTVSKAGISNAEIYVLLVALQNEVSALSSTVNGMQGEVTALQNKTNQMQSALSALTERVEALENQP